MFCRYILPMPSQEQVIRLLAPAADAILAADADAIARIQARSDDLVILDAQPIAAAMANERRAVVATRMRTEIGPRHGWRLRDEHLTCGAYEWELEHGVVLRLSKTTPVSRSEAMLLSLGYEVQASLFELPRVTLGTDDVVLVRLNGGALSDPTIDVASLTSHGHVEYRLAMSTIAKASTSTLISETAPKAVVELPADKLKQRPTSEA